MHEIKVSVIIPVYNTEPYLKQCLDSIQKQTLHEIEIICVDDGSSDNSVKIIEGYKNNDDRFSLICKKHQDGTGAGPARNLGLQHAKGKYVIFLDADDFFEPNMLEEMYLRAEQMIAQIVICNAFVYNNVTGKERIGDLIFSRKYIPQKQVFAGTDFPNTLFQMTWGGAWNLLILHDYVKSKGFQFQATRFQDDVLFTYLALAEADRITALDQPFIHYRQNINTNQSATQYEHIEIMYSAPKMLKEKLAERMLYDTFKTTFLNRFIPPMIMFLLNQRDYQSFNKCYDLLRGELAHDLDLIDYLSLPFDKIDMLYIYNEYRSITEKTSIEYLLSRSVPRILSSTYQIPKVLDNCNVILYGAGGYGKRVYAKILEYHNACKVVGWVDKDYKKIGFPVQSPNSILNEDYDYILITIGDENIQKIVKKNLCEMNICEEKILTLERIKTEK